MKNRPVISGVAVSLILVFSASAQGAIVLGQVDDFEDGSVMNWAGGLGPVNVPDGGPLGLGDNYLHLSSNGGFGPGSHLGAFNQFQWAGDYASANVTAVVLDMANFGATDLEIRLMLFGLGGEFTSTNAVALPADGLWHSIALSVLPADLTSVGGFDINATLSGVSRLLIRHQSGPPLGPGQGTPIAAEAGLDNITAVPEPATALLVALPLIARRRRRVR